MRRKVMSQTPKTGDLEIHVSTLATESGTFGEIREYVVSLDQYGRGVTFPLTEDTVASLDRGIAALKKAL